MAACIVSFVDLDGVRHSVELQAEGLYEAAILGLAAFRKSDLNPGGLTELEVEVRSSIKHTLTVNKTQEWLQRGVRTPKEAVLRRGFALLFHRDRLELVVPLGVLSAGCWRITHFIASSLQGPAFASLPPLALHSAARGRHPWPSCPRAVPEMTDAL